MNSFLSSALKAAGALTLAAVVGCGSSDGSEEFDRGKKAYEGRNLAEAERQFAKSLELSAANADAWVYLAMTEIDLGHLAEAATALTRAAQLAGEGFDIQQLRARLAWHNKNYDEARRLFTALSRNRAATPRIRAQAFTGLGIVEMTVSNRDAARVALLLAVREDHTNASAWYHLAQLNRNLFGYTSAAMECYEFFVRLAEKVDSRVKRVQQTVIPELREQSRHESVSRSGAGKRDSAACSKAILDAEGALKNRRLTQARRFYELAVAADPLSHPAVMGLAQTIRRIDTSAKGRKLVLRHLLAACELKPDSLSNLLEAADLASALGENATAAACYSRALAADFRNLTVIDGLIRALRKCGRRGEARIYQSYRDHLKPVARR